jgi:outer membrane protein assembly factor BamB
MMPRPAILLALLASGCLPAWASAPPRAESLPGQVLGRPDYAEPLRVFDASTGTRRRNLTETERARSFVADDGVVYAVAGHEIWATRIADGTELWRHVNESGRYHALLTQDDERLYLIRAPASGRLKERLVAVRRRDGALLWSKVLDSRDMWRPPSRAPVRVGGLVVAPDDGAFVAFDPKSGRPRWRVETDEPSEWLSADGQAVYAVVGKELVAVTLAEGRPLWSQPIGRPSCDDPWLMSPPAASVEGRVVFRRGPRLVALDATTTQPLWTGPAVSSAVFGDDLAFVKLADQGYGLVDLRDGSLRWQLRFDDELDSTPTFAEVDGLVLIRTDDDDLRAYELASGRQRWRVEL